MAPAEVGGDHFRSSAVMYTQCHPKLTEGSDVKVGTSLDQLFVKRFGQDTPIPSMQLSIEPVDQSGGCAYGYACVYTDTISWAAPDQPLPMVRDPRMVFEQLFGAGGTAGAARPAPRDRPQHPRHAARADGATCGGRSARPIGSGSISTPTNIREVEQRIQRIEAAQPERRGARAAGRAGRRARLVRRARQDHVRPAAARVHVGHDARVLVQVRARRLRPRLSGQRRRHRLPQRVAPRRDRGDGSSSSPRSTSTTSRCCRTSSRS